MKKRKLKIVPPSQDPVKIIFPRRKIVPLRRSRVFKQREYIDPRYIFPIEPSIPWALHTSLSLLALTSSAVLTFHSFGFSLICLCISLITALISSLFWYLDVNEELKYELEKFINEKWEKFKDSLTLKNLMKLTLFLILSFLIRYLFVSYETGYLAIIIPHYIDILNATGLFLTSKIADAYTFLITNLTKKITYLYSLSFTYLINELSYIPRHLIKILKCKYKNGVTFILSNILSLYVNYIKGGVNTNSYFDPVTNKVTSRPSTPVAESSRANPVSVEGSSSEAGPSSIARSYPVGAPWTPINVPSSVSRSSPVAEPCSAGVPLTAVNEPSSSEEIEKSKNIGSPKGKEKETVTSEQDTSKKRKRDVSDLGILSYQGLSERTRQVRANVGASAWETFSGNTSSPRITSPVIPSLDESSEIPFTPLDSGSNLTTDQVAACALYCPISMASGTNFTVVLNIQDIHIHSPVSISTPLNVHRIFTGAHLDIDLHLSSYEILVVDSSRIKLMNAWLDKFLTSTNVYELKKNYGPVLFMWNGPKNPFFLVHSEYPGIKSILNHKNGQKTVLRMMAYQEAYIKGVRFKLELLDDVSGLLTTCLKTTGDSSLERLPFNVQAHIHNLKEYEHLSYENSSQKLLTEINNKRIESRAYLERSSNALIERQRAWPQVRYNDKTKSIPLRGVLAKYSKGQAIKS